MYEQADLKELGKLYSFLLDKNQMDYAVDLSDALSEIRRLRREHADLVARRDHLEKLCAGKSIEAAYNFDMKAAVAEAVVRAGGAVGDSARTVREHCRDITADGAIDRLEGEVARIKAAVQLHYDQRGDQRCWLDDLKLYHDVLGVCPDPYITAMPPEPDAEESCRRYRAQRQAPEVAGKAMLPGGMTIAQLTEEVDRLRAERSDDRALLIGLARAYGAAKARFGTPGQETWWQFPSIQGSRMVRAVERLAEIEGDLKVADPDGVVRRAAGGLDVRLVSPPLKPIRILHQTCTTRYPDDVARVVRVLAEHGYRATPEQAALLWRMHEEAERDGDWWPAMPEDGRDGDDEVFAAVEWHFEDISSQ